MVIQKDDKLIDFDPSYPFLLPENWKDKAAPSVYEILATTNTLKKMYVDKVKAIEEGSVSNDDGEDALRKIATKFQTLKSMLYQAH